MKDQKKLSRREAIKLLGTATGASLLANLPSKWSRPELSGGFIPAHAQTSLCPAGQSTLTVFVQGNIPIENDIVGSFTASGTHPTGRTYFFDCQSGCLYAGFESGNPLEMVFTVNGDVVYEQQSGGSHFISVNAATGESQVDGYASGCEPT